MAAQQVICDTDVMIDYFDQKKVRHIQTKDTLEKEIGLDNILISAITKMEPLAGASNKAELNSINKKLTKFSVLLISPAITISAINLIQNYRLSHGLALADGMIAATVLEAKLPLFTYNSRDFRFINNFPLYLY